jgi:hypothetical protein
VSSTLCLAVQIGNLVCLSYSSPCFNQNACQQSIIERFATIYIEFLPPCSPHFSVTSYPRYFLTLHCFSLFPSFHLFYFHNTYKTNSLYQCMTSFCSYFRNKIMMCMCSPTMEYFSQPPLVVLPVLPHIGTVTAEASWICDHVTVYEIFHPSVCCVALEDFRAWSKGRRCCFDFVLGFCKSFLMQHAESCDKHTPFPIHTEERGVCCSNAGITAKCLMDLSDNLSCLLKHFTHTFHIVWSIQNSHSHL